MRKESLLLEILDKGMVACGFAPAGATGVHDIELPSFAMVIVPSLFWYAAEPLSSAMSFP